jgi:hypothetical protein
VVRLFGKPIRHETKVDPSPHGGSYKVEYHYATFTAAEAWFALAEAQGGALLWQRFTIKEPGSRIAPQKWLGRPLSDVSSGLGAPDQVSEGRASYNCDENRSLELVLNSGRITAVEWLGYVD